MNLHAIDLRLLIVFDAVMRERNVTRAAGLLGMSQPAVTGALNRLRAILDDRLFVRVTGGVRPTPRAEALALPIHNALIQLESALDPTDFSPAACETVFTLASSVHASLIALPHLARVMSAAAPKARLRVYAKNNEQIFGQLETGEVDLALGVIHDPPADIRTVSVMRDAYVCVMRKDHPLTRRPMTAEDYFRADHLDISHGGEADHYLDRAVAGWKAKRRPAITVSQTILVTRVLEQSDLLFTTFRRLAPELPGVERLHVAPLPLAVKPVEITLAWHEIVDDHAPHRWLREQIVAIFGRLKTAESGSAGGYRPQPRQPAV